MSTIQIQKPKYEEFARILENSPCRQIKYKFTDNQGGFCADGILAKAFGWNGYGSIYEFLARTEFIDEKIFSKIHYLNDRKDMTKQEIADWLREQK